MARRFALAPLVALMLAFVPAAGAANWTAQNMAIPQTVQGQLFSVSCATRGACEGVGQTVDAHGNTRAMAESWTGSAWKAQSVPNFDAPITSLSGVSCTAPYSCVAVGSYQGNTSGGTVAMRWDGSGWAVQPMPSIAGKTPFLNSVSCGAANSCTAAGFQIDNQRGVQSPLIEVWDGSAWQVQQAPTPSGAVGASLGGVSCTSATDCTAVGAYFHRTGPQLPYAMSRTSTTWHLESVPAPPGALASFPTSISCSAADACTAVGSYATQRGQLGLAERWNGFAWTRQTVPAPSGNLVALAGVSCSSATSCTAVGGTASPATPFGSPLVEAWDGSSWKAQATPSEPGAFLNAVSCPTTSSCTTVGAPGPTTGAESLRGRILPRPGLLSAAPRVSSLGLRWMKRPAAPVAPRNPFARPATGSAQTRHAAPAGGSLTLAERWDGHAWTVEPTPSFSGAAISQAIGVSCASPSSCFATGVQVDNSNGAQLPLLERWDGSKWSIGSVPTPAGVIGARLFDVSCTAPNACTAVGEAFTTRSEVAYADRWDGTKWTAQQVPGKAGLGTALGSVSCTGAKSCTAAGAFLNDTNGSLTTLVEFWNGSKWAIQSSANHSGNYSSFLYGISCTSAGSCMSVGGFSSNTSFASGPLSERSSGGKWMLESFPAPTNAGFTLPQPVSCTGPSACAAVGTYFNSTSAGPFADRWNGTRWVPENAPSGVLDFYSVSCLSTTACLATSDATGSVWDGTSWSVQPLAPPPFGSFPSLQAVTCGQTAACTGVGSAVTGEPVPLAETFS